MAITLEMAFTKTQKWNQVAVVLCCNQFMEVGHHTSEDNKEEQIQSVLTRKPAELQPGYTF